MPVAGGMGEMPFRMRGVLTYRTQEEGYRRCHSQKGTGRKAPTRRAYSSGWYGELEPN